MRMICLLCIVAIAGVAGCGPAQTNQPIPGPPIAGLNLNGKWYSDEFGDMMLIQDKNGIRGTYEDPRGPDHNGRLTGIVQGDLINIEWIKPGNPVAAVMPVRGKGWLRILQGGKRLEGVWGYDDVADDGGKWTAEKSQH
jgi:hypothetical protein